MEEELLVAWVGLTGMLKNSRLTGEMPYNEAIVMMMLYKQFQKDGEGEIPVGEVIEKSRMLKSLVNRVINSLEKKGYLKKCKNKQDSRKLYIRPTEQGIDRFLVVHRQSLALAGEVMAVIGKEDAGAIVRAYEKLKVRKNFGGLL